MRMKEDYMKNGQLAFIKPANYEISKTRRYRADISKTGYEIVKTQYTCETCDGCPYKAQCIKGNIDKY